MATTESTNAVFRTSQYERRIRTFISDSAAAITTAASAVCGRSCSSDGRNSSKSTTIAAPTSPVTWDLEPACSATAVREPLDETAKPWNRPAAAFAAPMPIIS